MKSRILLFLFLFVSILTYSQENCTNGIDDDSDGLIDLNDPDCNCHTFSQIPSIIPNPSFEAYDYCPSGFSEMDAAQNWIQATDATSDYYNINASCNFYPINFPTNLNTIPDGSGFVGAHYIQDYKEYVGTSLPSTLHAGTTYEIEFNVAGSAYSWNGFITLTPNQLSPTKITLYGCANGNNLPIHTMYSPNSADPTWVVLGEVLYTPATVWSTQVIRFTPTFNVNAVILGPETNLPADYGTLNTGYPYPYFFYDNLKLNKSSNVTISSTGDYCSQNMVLNSTINNPEPNVTYTYQWYNNGISIVGATGSSYTLTTYNATSSYAVSIFDGTNCLLSNSINPSASQVSPPSVIPVTYCQNETALPLTATGSNLLWYASATGGVGSPTAITPSTANAGDFHYYVSQSCGGSESTRADIVVTILPKLTPNFPQINPICFQAEAPVLGSTSPNGIQGSWFPGTVSNTESGDYTFTPNTGVCAYNQTLTISVIPPIDFHIDGNCQGHDYFLNAIPETGSFDLNTLDFTWTYNNGTPVLANQPSLNITELVNGTTEEEVFPLLFELTISDSNNCSSIQQFNVQKAFCNIQKGISVNDDGDNDFFDLSGLNVEQLDIYNRYGMIVYSKGHYINEWKGQSNSGDELPSATYFYKIQTDATDIKKTGWIYLLR